MITNESLPRSIIQRSRILEGSLVYSIINNGAYFLIDLPVYEDGVVDCWELEDFPGLKEKLQSGFLTPTVPNGAELSIHHLGIWKIDKAEWLFTSTSYFDYLLSLVRRLNPGLTNLFESEGKKARVIGNTNYSTYGLSGEIFRKDDSKPSFINYKGSREHVFFLNDEEKCYLASYTVFRDGTILIEGIPKPRLCSTQEFVLLANEGILTTSVPDNTFITIENLGRIQATACIFKAGMEDKVKEVYDIISGLNNQSTTSSRCSELYKEYLKNPGKSLKEKLKKAYEEIPRHLQKYVLGDQENKDYYVRKIIYDS